MFWITENNRNTFLLNVVHLDTSSNYKFKTSNKLLPWGNKTDHRKITSCPDFTFYKCKYCYLEYLFVENDKNKKDPVFLDLN